MLTIEQVIDKLAEIDIDAELIEVFDEDNRDTENDPFKGTSIEGKD